MSGVQSICHPFATVIFKIITEQRKGSEHAEQSADSLPIFVRARPCFQDGVFRVPKNGMLETNKPLAMRVVGNALAYRKNLQCYNNAGSPTALQAEEVSIWI